LYRLWEFVPIFPSGPIRPIFWSSMRPWIFPPFPRFDVERFSRHFLPFVRATSGHLPCRIPETLFSALDGAFPCDRAYKLDERRLYPPLYRRPEHSSSDARGPLGVHDTQRGGGLLLPCPLRHGVQIANQHLSTLYSPPLPMPLLGLRGVLRPSTFPLLAPVFRPTLTHHSHLKG